MHRLIFATLLVLLVISRPASACRMAASTAPLPERVGASRSVFLGRVAAAGQNQVTFTVLASPAGSATGLSKVLPHRAYGECGELNFRVGDLWLYFSDQPWSGSLPVVASDLGNDDGRDFAAVVNRIAARINPVK